MTTPEGIVDDGGQGFRAWASEQWADLSEKQAEMLVDAYRAGGEAYTVLKGGPFRALRNRKLAERFTAQDGVHHVGYVVCRLTAEGRLVARYILGEEL